ncbi:MAG: hypothetical protein AAGA44_17095 [Pseudomonadota bacterium]
MDTAHRLNAWLGVIANLGILVGLIFVAVELNQNTRQLSLTLEWEVNQKMADNNRDMLSAESQSLFAKSILNPEDLSFAEFSGASVFAFNYWNVWEDRLFLYQNGLLSDAEWKGFIADDIAPVMGNAFTQALWQESKYMYDDEFITYVDSLLSDVDTDATYRWYLDTLKRLEAGAAR